MKKARAKQGLTQSQLAERVGTTQQTIARWEAGKVEPNLAALRDLAICLSTSVDHLLDRKPVFEHQTTDPLSWLAGDKSGYWGNIGIRFPNSEFSTWYPITTLTMERMHGALANLEKESWIVFQTLNNKMVICRPAELHSIMFLDEADDGVEGDWEVGPDDVEGWPREIYECLEFLMWDALGAGSDGEGFSEKLVTVAKSLIEEHQLDEEKLMAMCVQTRVVHTNGVTRRLHVSTRQLADAMFHFDLGAEYLDIEMLHLDDNDGDRPVFLPLNQISLLEFPLIALSEGMKRQTAEDMGTDADDGDEDD